MSYFRILIRDSFFTVIKITRYLINIFAEKYDIEQLPKDILDEIFSFMRTRKSLRLVSKRFIDVVKYSSRLMHKYALNVSKISHDCEEPIDSFCQAMKFYNLSLNLDEFKWINNYQHKERIK